MLLGLGEDDIASEVEVGCEGRSLMLGEVFREHAAGAAIRRRVRFNRPFGRHIRATLTRAESRLPNESADGTPLVHVVLERAPGQDWRWMGRADPLSAFAHEMKNALTSLREALALLRDGAGGEVSDVQLRLLNGAGGDADRMMRLADQMTDTGRVRCGRSSFTPRCVDVA